MEFSVDRILTMKMEGDEIDTFLDILDVIKKKSIRSGFNKSFSNESKEFIDALHYNLIGHNEENSDKSHE